MSEEMHPAIDYTSKDFFGFRRLMLDAKSSRIPEWTSESPSDLGVTIIESVAYMGDVLSFYGDRIATEAFLSTATTRRAVLDIARMLDYRPTGNAAATVDVQFNTEQNVGTIVIPEGTRVTTGSFGAVSQGEQPIPFETMEELVIETDASNAGLVPAQQGVTITDERVAISDGSIEQRYRLFRHPVIHDTTRIFVEEGAGPVEWTHFDRLIDARSNQNAFTTEEDEDGGITVIFGDGLNGRVPSRDAVIEARYRVGGGEIGNVGANTLVEIPDSIHHVTAVSNPEAATGGADAESIDQIRINAPRGLTALTRAVSLADYANLSLQVPGIAKAKATAPAYNTVVIFVAPFGGGPANQTKKEEVSAYLQDKKLVTTSVFIDDPDYIPLDIHVGHPDTSPGLHVREEYSRSAVKGRVEEALVSLFKFDRVDFGFFMALSRVYDVINNVEGVQHANVTLLDRSGGNDVDNVQLDDFEIPIIGEIVVDASGGIPGS